MIHRTEPGGNQRELTDQTRMKNQSQVVNMFQVEEEHSWNQMCKYHRRILSAHRFYSSSPHFRRLKNLEKKHPNQKVDPCIPLNVL